MTVALIITITSLLTTIADALLNPEIGVECGKLTVQGYNSCEIIHNDEVIPYNGPDKTEIPNLLFGLITYRCDHDAGYFMSNVDCEKCNLNCKEEASVEPPPCPADPTQFWAGLIMGMLVYALIGGLTYKRLLGAPVDVGGRTVNVSETRAQDEEQEKPEPMGFATLKLSSSDWSNER